MAGPPDLSHPSLSQLLLQPVAPQFTGALHLRPQMINHAGSHIRHAHHQEIGEHQSKEELGRVEPD